MLGEGDRFLKRRIEMESGIKHLIGGPARWEVGKAMCDCLDRICRQGEQEVNQDESCAMCN